MPRADRRGHALKGRDRAAVRARRLFAGYGSRSVLGPLSFVFPEGRTSVLLGPGGAGKTTLLQVLQGAPSGDLWWHGDLNLPAEPPRRLDQKELPEADTLAAKLRACQVSEMAAFLETEWAAAPPVGEALRQILDQPLRAVPFPLARLASLTLVLAGSPAFILLDEPDAELGEPWLEWLLARLEALRGRATVVVATHHLGLGRRVADRVFLLIEGRIVESGEASQFFSHPVHPRTQSFVRLGS